MPGGQSGPPGPDSAVSAGVALFVMAAAVVAAIVMLAVVVVAGGAVRTDQGARQQLRHPLIRIAGTAGP